MHVSIQAQKDFFRQICRTAGHAGETPSGRCSRCKKQIRQGFRIYESTGYVIHYAKGVSKIIVS